MSYGYFITFEGGEGAGKTTQMALLGAALRNRGYRVTETREPGGTAVGAEIRRLLLDYRQTAIQPRTELLLYEASRAQLADEIILPALQNGQIVLSDRFVDSTKAYQGAGRGLPLHDIHTLNVLATGGIWPDLTILLDLDPTVGLARIATRHLKYQHAPDRLETEALTFHVNVRKAYQHLAKDDPQHFYVLDATLPIDKLHARICAKVVKRLARVRYIPPDTHAQATRALAPIPVSGAHR